MIHHNGIIIDPARHSIYHNGCEHLFNIHGNRNTSKKSYVRRGRSMVFDTLSIVILAGEISKVKLFDHIYGHCRHGGPVDGPHIFDVRFHQWQPIIKGLQLKLVKDRRNSTMYYSLLPDPKPFMALSAAGAIAAHVV